MKYLIIAVLAAIVSCLIVSHQAQVKADKGLTKFIGHPSVSIWAETLSSGETRHYTKWDNCTAVIGETNNVFTYVTQPTCDNKE